MRPNQSGLSKGLGGTFGVPPPRGHDFLKKLLHGGLPGAIIRALIPANVNPEATERGCHEDPQKRSAKGGLVGAPNCDVLPSTSTPCASMPHDTVAPSPTSHQSNTGPKPTGA